MRVLKHLFLLSVLLGWAVATFADSSERTKPQNSLSYPEGNVLYCEVKYRISFMNGRFEEASFESFSPYVALIPVPSAGQTIVVNALRIARRYLWDQWKAELQRLKKETPGIDEIWFLKTEYWTNVTASRPTVTKFVRLYVAPPVLGPGQEPEIPDSDLSNPPSDFSIGLPDSLYNNNF